MPLLMLLLVAGVLDGPQRAAPSPAYIVGPQDKLAVTVFDEPSLTKTVTIDAKGAFEFPLIGRVQAAGLTVRAVQEDVTARLKKDFLVNPQVSIEVEIYRSQLVYVTGQVHSPGAVPLMGSMTVMEALAKAGSPAPDAGPYILINRRSPQSDDPGDPPQSGARMAQEKVSMVDLQNGRAQDITLNDGDTIFVPRAEAFYVTGQVRNPGPYLLGSEITIAKALSMAGGVTERGSRSRIRLTRLIDSRQVVLKNVKLEDLVQPGDSIEVLPRLF